ncbi:hypothetical protein P692DRAFT_20512170 [Suillus brevipes Sb2]|nr:hypothetical protein P692DRAFT_20512170 [Suillus brevipes Sb2]
MSATGRDPSVGATVLPLEARITHYDQYYDPRVLTTVYKKTNVNNQLKHLKRLNQKKPVIVVRRIMDSKGRYSRTEIDIRSQCEVLIEIHRGAEGLDLLIAKFSRL